ncbi:hypothetical protein CHUAL_002743 [Chamberlinius hualienensis]
MASRRFSCGLDVSGEEELSVELTTSNEAGYDFISCPITIPEYNKEFFNETDFSRDGPFTRPDVCLSGKDWGTLVVAKISAFLDVDSEDEKYRKKSEKALEQELNFATHLGIPAIILPQLKGRQPNLARIIYSRTKTGLAYQTSYQIWVSVPMKASSSCSSSSTSTCASNVSRESGLDENGEPISADSGEESEDYGEDTWEWWNDFRSVCNSHRKIGVILELAADLPCDIVIQRWLGEPVRCLSVPTSLFLTNKKGFPVLSRAHQAVIRRFYNQDTQVLVTGKNQHSDVKHYQQYLDFLWQNQPNDCSIAQYARGYEDCLQCPLQPLADNLESQTYEIFEKDPVKYSKYKEAITRAIADKTLNPELDETLIIMVVGAGRGPLVQASLQAAEMINRKVHVYAVEKNPNAVVTLRHFKKEQWGDLVDVVACDMREWESPEKADIIVSELLGSFADNELSPECLDSAQNFLKEDGISIPESYSSYLRPIQSAKLFGEIHSWKETNVLSKDAFETGYVVKLHNKYDIADPQKVFTFQHPNKADKIDNSRYIQLHYDANINCVLHGFAGYFDTVLYKDVVLSIHPQTHSLGMFSWFPIFFPIRYPIYVKKNSKVTLQFWRHVSLRKVWYEWCVTSPSVSTVYNLNGHAYSMGL